MVKSFSLAFMVLAIFVENRMSSVLASEDGQKIHDTLKITVISCSNAVADDHAVFDLEVLNESDEPIRISKFDLYAAFQIHSFLDSDKVKWRAKKLAIIGDLPTDENDFSETIAPGKVLRLKVPTRVLEAAKKPKSNEPAEFKFKISDHITVADPEMTRKFKAMIVGDGKFKSTWSR